MDKKLVLENGKIFYGNSFGASSEAVAEVVFNTSMAGYQEILSDNSYFGQMVCMTYPIIGSYGINDDDFESRIPKMGGFIVEDYNDAPSNFRQNETLSETMVKHNIPGISGIDTRALTRIIRSEGSMKAAIVDAKMDDKKAVEYVKKTIIKNDHVEQVSTKKSWSSKTANPKYKIVAFDCGIKLNIVRRLNKHKCNVTIVPHNTTIEQVKALKPDALFFSNGPGNPEDNKEMIELIKHYQSKLPIFGICLGHQMIALANNAKTYKMKFGHRGGNHPVKNLQTGKVEITSQNHSFAVDTESLKKTKLETSHINVLDNTIEGLESKEDYIFCVQYHPESAAGPEDSEYLFKKFTDNIERFYKEKK